MSGEFGYAGKILKVDLSSGSITDIPTDKYADKFIGGGGIAAKIWWDELIPEISAFDPENRLIFITGPLGGLPKLGGSRWLICGKSPGTEPEHFSYSNLGGTWGAHLKFAGYDGIVVQGKSEKPVYLLVQDGDAELRDARALWGRSTIETRDLLKVELGSVVRVVATGPAGENLVSMASTLADDDASGTGGFGAVMGSKNIKAIAVRGNGKIIVAKPERLQELTKYIRELTRGRPKPYQFLGWRFTETAKKLKSTTCFGCTRAFGCMRSIYEAEDGEKGKWMCEAGDFYINRAIDYYGELNDVPFKVTKICDKYGVDISAIGSIIRWLMACHSAGILNDDSIGIPISKVGSIEFMEVLVRKISHREGFGDTLADGIYRAADSLGNKAREIIADRAYKAGQVCSYGPRLYITNGLSYAMEPRRRIGQLHEIGFPVAFEFRRWIEGTEGAHVSGKIVRAIAKRFWGSEIASDFSNYEGKALAAKMIQDREYIKDSLVLCDWAWPIFESRHTENHVGDPTLESKLYSAVTGNEVDEEGLYKIGDRLCNLQRSILVREGRRGRQDDQLGEFNYTIPIKVGFEINNPKCLVTGKDGEPLIKDGAVVDRAKFEKMLEEYYKLRGWDVHSGLQTKVKLEELSLEDVARDLEPRGLIK